MAGSMPCTSKVRSFGSRSDCSAACASNDSGCHRQDVVSGDSMHHALAA